LRTACLVDLLGGDMLDQDIAQDIVAGGVQPVTGLRVFVQPPLQGFHGQQLHLDQLFQDVVELRSCRARSVRQA